MNALLLVTFAALAPPRLKVEDWSVVRERKHISGATNRVTTRFSLANVSEAPVKEVRARIVFYDTTGKVSFRMPRARVKRIEPAGKEAVAISSLMVPAFLYYELFLTYRYEGREESVTMLGTSAATGPDILSDRLLKKQVRLVPLARDIVRNQKGVAVVWTRVKNFGELEAREVKCIVRLYGYGHKKIGEITYRGTKKKPLGPIKGGEEREVKFVLYNVPRYAGYDIYMKFAPPSKEELYSGGEFEMKEDVEVAHVKLYRTAPAVLVVELDVRNGLKQPAENVVVTAVFQRKEMVKKTREDGLVGVFEEEVAFRKAELKPLRPLEPGEVVHLKKTLRNMGSFLNMLFEIGFGEKEEKAAVAPVEAARIEVAVARAVLKPDGTVEIAGTLSNAGKKPVGRVSLKFHFRKKEGGKPVDVHVEEVQVEGPIAPGGKKDFVLAVPDCPLFEEYYYEVSSE